ncbi:MAG: ATP-binding cassette domain-containing protein, partial [Coriobacteriaceae bacterium]|nr:ATP-binding cassette domain-containing protein [Coriobacteriaceae bacterium]
MDGVQTAVEFDDVTYAYAGAASPALDHVSLSVGEGEFVCIIGSNGSGKSTLARHMNALLVPDAGKVRVFGHDTSAAGAAYQVRPRVGMVFQDPDSQS